VPEPAGPLLVPGELEAALDRRFTGLATGHGATPVDPTYLLSRAFLDRVEFFSSFPRRAIPAEGTDSFLPPATCYRLFQALQGSNLDAPLVATLTGPCFRREPRYDLARRHAFTMREAVIVADEEGTAAARDGLAEASLELGRTLGIDAALEEAEDPFFAEAGRAKRLLQRLLRLKVELVATVASERLAIASFNLHQDFFGTRLDTKVGGAPAWSSCAAWGIERWRLALEESRGSDGWSEEVTRALSG
jgi:seryl-tRNA synthetase